MKLRRLLWRFFASHLLVLGLFAAAALIFLRAVLVNGALEEERLALYDAARRAAVELEVTARSGRLPDAGIVAARHGLPGEKHLVVLNTGAQPISGSGAAHLPAGFPTEAQLASARGTENGVTGHHPPGESAYLFALVPVSEPTTGSVTGYVTAWRPAGPVRAAAVSRWSSAAKMIGLAGIMAAALGLMFSVRFSQPIEMLRRGAERFGQGRLRRRVPVPPGLELAELAEALNRMAAQLDERIGEITRQRNEREAILESMQEGVLAVDNSECVLSINRAAEEYLGITGRGAVGRLVQEVCRNVELQRVLAQALAGDFSQPEEGGPYVRSGKQLILEARCAPLRDGAGRRIGVVVILANVTRLHQLENLRREFVANVSHELRTPITSIKGFAETLLDGALDDPEEAKRFVEIINRQSDRLGTVIEDLLSLSRLDRATEIEKAPGNLAQLLTDAVEACQPMAEDQGVALELSCPEDAELHINNVLMQQALTNLIENAVKYSGQGRLVSVRGEVREDRVRIHVTDNGPGIEPQHLARLFERFYRVDKARSREVGGTGLGLSIVKNVAQVHGGRVSVESKVGEGSDFCIELPAERTHQLLIAAK